MNKRQTTQVASLLREWASDLLADAGRDSGIKNNEAWLLFYTE